MQFFNGIKDIDDKIDNTFPYTEYNAILGLQP